MTDLRRYRDLMTVIRMPAVDEMFELLHAIEKIYMVDAKELPSIVEESELNKMDQSELKSFISKRSDFEKSWIGKYI